MLALPVLYLWGIYCLALCFSLPCGHMEVQGVQSSLCLDCLHRQVEAIKLPEQSHTVKIAQCNFFLDNSGIAVDMHGQDSKAQLG